ncbi:hypothetical protein LCGC14_2656770, partial [marine sediment metagenome]
RGLERGFRMGMLRREQSSREESRGAQQDLTKLQAANTLLNNKNIPDAVKLDVYNQTFRKLWNKAIGSGDADPLSTTGMLPELDEWNNKIGTFADRALKIRLDKTIPEAQKREAYTAIEVEAGGEVDLTGMIQRSKERSARKLQSMTDRAFLIMTSDEESQTDAEELGTIRDSGPQGRRAIIQAGKMVQERRGEIDLGQGVKDVLASKGIDPSKLDVTNPIHARAISNARAQVKQEQTAQIRQRGAGVEEEKRKTAFATQALRVQDAVRNIDQIVKVIDESPETFGASGAVSASVVGVADQIGSFARILNPNFSVDEKVSKIFDQFDDFASGTISEAEFADRSTEPFRARLERIAKGNRVLQGRIMGLAISLATLRAIDGRGRLTSDMVARQLDEIGTRTQSPAAFRESMLRVRADIIGRVQERERIMLRGEVPTFGQPPQKPERSPET